VGFSTHLRPQLKDNSIEFKGLVFLMQKQLLIFKKYPYISGASIFQIIMPVL